MRPHHFLSVTKEGRTAIFSTAGNEDCHVILRGGKAPNFDADHVQELARQMASAGLAASIMIDLSHANSLKQPLRQLDVARDMVDQVARGERRIIGAMIESHLVEGRQDVVPGKSLVYGQSITDACMGWNDTAHLLGELAGAARERRKTLAAA